MHTDSAVSESTTAVTGESSEVSGVLYARAEPDELPITPRELDVLLAMCDGLTAQGVADRLGLSVKTVSTYRARIFEKLGVRNNTQVGIWAERVGLLRDVIVAGVAPRVSIAVSQVAVEQG